MQLNEPIIQAIYQAIDEVNGMLGPDEVLERSLDAVLVGESGNLDSLSFLSFAVTVEENIERAFNETISLTEIVASVDDKIWTAGNLATSIEELLNGAARDGAVS